MNVLFAIMLVVFFVVVICGIIGISLDFVRSIYQFTRMFRKCAKDLDSSFKVTEGVTVEGRYSLCIQNYGGIPCLVVHDCEECGGLHYSSMNSKSFVTAIAIGRLDQILRDFDERRYLFVDKKNGMYINGDV